MRHRLTVLFTVCLALLVAAPLAAQTIPADQQAEVAIRIDMKRLRESPLGDHMRTAFEQMASQSGIPEGVDPSKVDELFVMIALPESVADFQAMENMDNATELPLEVFARVVVNDEAALDELMNEAVADSDTREINGKTYYAPREGKGPTNVMVQRVDSKTVEFGTENYFRAGTGNHLMSTGLQSSWGKVPEAAIQIVVDLENARPLVDEGVAMAKENADGMTSGIIDLATKINDIRLTLDVSGDNLLTLAATGRDDESATRVREGLDALLAVGKMSGQGLVRNLKEQDEESSKVLQTILNSLKANQDGTTVEVTIPKPDGFEGAIERISQMGGMR